MTELVFRVNANEAIGFGHFMRCFSLARFVRDSFVSTFIMNAPPNWIKVELGRRGFHLISLQEIPQYHPDHIESANKIEFEIADVLDWNGKIVVIDGYRFGADYYLELYKLGAFTIAFTDSLPRTQFTKAFITPLFIELEELQSLQAAGIHVFSGRNGFLIRPEFYSDTPIIQSPRRFDFFIYVGQNLSLARYLSEVRLKNSNVAAIVTDSFAEVCQNAGWNVHTHPTVNETIQLMIDSNHAILPASTIALEYAIITKRKPEVFVSAENQMFGFQQYIKSGIWGGDEISSKGKHIPLSFQTNATKISELLSGWLSKIQSKSENNGI